MAGNTPSTSKENEGAYVHYEEKVEGRKIQARSDSFKDHFSQARLFWNSMTSPEKQHIIEAFSFEVGKVKNNDVKQQVVNMFAHVDKNLATIVAGAVGVEAPDVDEVSEVKQASPALSQESTPKLAKTRKIGVLIGNGFIGEEVKRTINALLEEGVVVDIISEKLGHLRGDNELGVEVDETFLTVHPVLYDGLYIVGGEVGNQKKFENDIVNFINEAYEHYKPIGIATTGKSLFEKSNGQTGPGIVSNSETSNFDKLFIEATAVHRHWDRKLL